MTVETSETQGNVETATTENNSADSQEIKEWGQEGEQEQAQAKQENGQETDKESESPKRNRAKERIEQLARENAELKRKQAEYEAKQQASETIRPKIDDFDSYAEYEDALEEYHVAKAEQRVLDKLGKQDAEKSQVQKQSEMESVITSFAQEHTDFDTVVQAGLARQLSMPVSLDEIAAEFGYDSQTQVRLLYELAKDEEFHEEVAHSSKLKAARLLSERADSWSNPKTPPPISKAPKPINPVQANAPASRDTSKMSDDEWYKAEIQKRKGK